MKAQVQATINGKPYNVAQMELPENEKERAGAALQVLKKSFPDKEIKVSKVIPIISG